MTFVLADGPEPKIIGENRLNGNMVATPVFANGSVFIRSFEALYCIR